MSLHDVDLQLYMANPEPLTHSHCHWMCEGACFRMTDPPQVKPTSLCLLFSGMQEATVCTLAQQAARENSKAWAKLDIQGHERYLQEGRKKGWKVCQFEQIRSLAS